MLLISRVSSPAGLFAQEPSQIKSAEEQLTRKWDTPVCPIDVAAMGPQKAIAKMKQALPLQQDRVNLSVVARTQAIVGSCRGSIESARSGMRAWLGFSRISCVKQAIRFHRTSTTSWLGQHCSETQEHLATISTTFGWRASWSPPKPMCSNILRSGGPRTRLPSNGWCNRGSQCLSVLR